MLIRNSNTNFMIFYVVAEPVTEGKFMIYADCA